VDDQLNRPVTGLEKENFRLYDDRMEEVITTFSTEDEPIALGLVFDTSGSMSETLPQGRQAAAQFLRIANPEDEFFLVEFSSSPRLVIPLTSDINSIHTEVLMSKSGGSTALIDALYLALNEMKKSKKTKKALVLISDGGEFSCTLTRSLGGLFPTHVGDCLSTNGGRGYSKTAFMILAGGCG